MGQLGATAHRGPATRASPSTPNAPGSPRQQVGRSRPRPWSDQGLGGPPAAMPTAHQVPKLAFDLWSGGPVVGPQAGSCWVVRARVSSAPWWPILILRPVAQVVHPAVSGQSAQAPAKAAIPPPAFVGRMATLTLAGHVTVGSRRSVRFFHWVAWLGLLGPGGQVVAGVGGPQAALKSPARLSCHGQLVGRCETSRCAELARRAGTAISCRRMVAVVALAWKVDAMVPAARVRLNAIAANASQALLAAKDPDGKCARALDFRSALTCSMMAERDGTSRLGAWSGVRR